MPSQKGWSSLLLTITWRDRVSFNLETGVALFFNMDRGCGRHSNDAIMTWPFQTVWTWLCETTWTSTSSLTELVSMATNLVQLAYQRIIYATVCHSSEFSTLGLCWTLLLLSWAVHEQSITVSWQLRIRIKCIGSHCMDPGFHLFPKESY